MLAAVLLDAGARVNAPGPDLATPLQLAVQGRHPGVVELLLRRKANPDWPCASGTTALHLAAQLDAVDITKLLIEHDADVNAAIIASTNHGVTALMLCANWGYLDMMKLLFDHQAKPELTDELGWTALHHAAAAGQVDAARLLLDRGADVHAAEKEGTTVFMRAAKMGQLEMVKFLLDRDAKLLDDRGKARFTALHEAADRGHPKVVEFLLDQGMSAKLRDNYDATPLIVCAQAEFSTQDRYAATARVLLAHDAEVNARVLGGQTALHRAGFWGHPRVMEVLLEAKAVDPSIRDDHGQTALDLAEDSHVPDWRTDVKAGRKECEKLLRKAAPSRKLTEGGKKTKP
jgi:ankyrin repeat protein